MHALGGKQRIVLRPAEGVGARKHYVHQHAARPDICGLRNREDCLEAQLACVWCNRVQGAGLRRWSASNARLRLTRQISERGVDSASFMSLNAVKRTGGGRGRQGSNSHHNLHATKPHMPKTGARFLHDKLTLAL